MNAALALGLQQRPDDRQHPVRGRRRARPRRRRPTSSQKPSTSRTGSSQTLPGRAWGPSPGSRGTLGRPAGIAAGRPAAARARRSATGALVPGRARRGRRARIEPSYGRRSVMQMEFPCSLNWTASTSFRMRKRPRPPASSSCSGRIGSGTLSGSNPGPSSVTWTRIASSCELGADVHPLVGDPRGCRAGWRWRAPRESTTWSRNRGWSGWRRARRGSGGSPAPPPPRCRPPRSAAAA